MWPGPVAGVVGTSADGRIGVVRTEIRKLLKQNSLSLLGLTCSRKGDLLYRTPVDWLVVGIFLDWVALDRFYLHAVADALYVPGPGLVLSVGDRLPRPNTSMQSWPPLWRPELGDADDQLLQALSSALRGATPLLDSIASPKGYVDYLNRRVDPGGRVPSSERAAYASLLMGRSVRQVRKELDEVLEVITERRQDHWEINGKRHDRPPDQFQDAATRVRTVLSHIGEGKDATEVLREWRDGSVGRLGLVTGVSPHPSAPERRLSRAISPDLAKARNVTRAPTRRSEVRAVG